jgi:hypothetical protein
MNTFYYERDLAAAQREMERALRANPDLSFASSSYPQMLWTVGLRD